MLTCGQLQADSPVRIKDWVHHNEWLEDMVSASEVHKRTEILLKDVTPESLENPNDKLVDGSGSL